ncbi:hypothetical protein C1645_762674 [Glomus cerebriforme]|uniref:Hyaluronan/mRNA-binding protein domain-containing protein n=1 Tax=Glomus cerebriforme TaxID=658196 RepID=A0A397T543_9GLOM|nr:hypothetical protein C1645_762674 [Glomus cerebriforme]
MASVVSRNIFDLLGESEDSETVVKEKEPPAKEQPVIVQKKVDRSRASPKEARIRHEYPQRGGHKPSTSNRNNEDTRSGAPRDRNVGPRLSGRREEGGGGGGGDYHSTRSSRGARPSDRGRGGRGGRRGGREYDRHSGTGRHDSEKKENQAWGKKTENWENNGAPETPNWNAEAKDSNNANAAWDDNTNDTNAEGTWGDTNTTNATEEKNDWNSGVAEEKSGAGDSWKATEETSGGWEQQPEPTETNWENKEEKIEDTAAGDSAPVPEPEPEEVVKTLEEYLAEKAQKSLDISLPEARKPNEGVDDSQWKDAVPLERDEEDDFLFVGKEQSYRLKNKKSKAKTFVEITQTFEKSGGASPRGRGRGRGGRGGRGGRDERDGRDRNNYDDNNRDNRRRGGGGGGRSVVNLDDTRAFPSLGAS